MSTSKKRKKKRTSGSRLCLAVTALTLLAAGSLPAVPAGKDKKAESFALIAGSVFRESGFSLPGAEITLDAVPGANPPAKFKRIKVIADARGEFAIRVAPVPMRYTVSVSARGLKPDRKEVSIQGVERVDLYFRLEPESK